MGRGQNDRNGEEKLEKYSYLQNSTHSFRPNGRWVQHFSIYVKKLFSKIKVINNNNYMTRRLNKKESS